MNDRFKFRAWWKPNYRKPIMLYDVEKTYDFMRGKPENVCADCFGEVLEDEDYIVMQCTGLKDKNGKLIYEGDIVKTDFKFSTVTVNPFLFDIGDVAFSEYFGGWVINSKENPAPYQQARLGKIDAENCEVIGNIYENKELLEVE